MRIFGRRFVLLAAALLVAAPTVFPGPAAAEEPPAPRLDRVQYDNPTSCVPPTSKMGVGQRAQGIARQLAGQQGASAAALGRILRWVDRNLRLDPRREATWRGMEDVIKQSRVATDGDRAYAIGALARATGIPTAWVKTVSTAWLLRAKPGDAVGADDTRTFLEVFLDQRWQLFDPVTARLYDNYDRSRQILPGGYLAYDKGADPYALVLDNRPAAFRAQLARFVAAFDRRRLPWSTSRDLLAPWRVYVTGQSGPATYAKEAARTLGFSLETAFDSNWDTHLAAARGSILIVTSRDRQPVLPQRFRAAWLPKGWQAAYGEAERGGKGWIAHRLADGTRVILVTVTKYGPVELAVSEALEG